MGARIRAHDWAATPLGPPEAWPVSLRTAVGMVIGSLFPACLVWGSQLTTIHNDAFRPILGAKPEALGRPFDEVWSEAWETIGPIAGRAFAGEATSVEDFPLTVERGSGPEEAFFTFCYSPVRDEAGRVAGILDTVVETTGKVLAERRQAFLLHLEERLRGLTDPHELTLAAAEALGRHLGAARAGYGEIDPEGGTVTVKRDWTDVASASLAGEARLLDAFGPGVIAELRAGRTLVVEDCLSDPRAAGDMHVATWASIGTRSLVVVPLVKNGALRAILYVHEPQPRRWGAAEVKLVEDTAHRTWAAVERAHAEAALRESEARFRAAVEAVHGVVWTNDAAGEMRGEQPAWAALTGQTQDEYRGYGWADAVHPEDARPTVEAWKAAVAEQRAFLFEHRVRRRDGAWRLFSVRAIPTFGADGSVREWVGVHTDVTDQRAGEGRLRELNETLEQRVEERTRERDRLWELSEDLLVAAGYDGRLLRASPSWTRLLGWDEGTLLARPYAEMIHPDDLGAVMDALRTMRATGRPVSFEDRVLTAEGTWRWIAWTLSPEPGGERLTGVGRDITEAKRAAETLRRSEARLRTIFETSYQYQGLMALDGTLLDANATSLEGIRAKLEDVVGRPFWNTPWFTGTPGMPEAVRAAVPRVAGGEAVRREIVVDLPTGRRAFDFSMRPIRDEHGTVVAIVPEAVETTERRRAEEQLRQAQKLEAMGQLTGGVAHDFNNLLTIIRSSADLLRRPDLPEERRRRYVDAISATVDRAAKITGQLLAFARRQALMPEVFDVAERIRGVADLLRTVVGARVRIEVHAPGERCFAEADVSQFETALVNMAVNARDAMEGGGALTVRAEAVQRMPPIRGHGGAPGSFVAVSVEDTGSGIPPDKLPHIFEPFFTTKEVGKGTGLGLSQVYGFAKQSGGDVAVESEVGRGATFTLYLPRAEGKETGEASEEGGTAPRPAPEGGGCRVLVVEDNVEVGTFSTQILQDLGYETAWAASGAEALALLGGDGARFDVVFSDVVMPGMGGVELGQEIRRRHLGMPVVLTSGYSHVLAEEGRHGFELLHKPYAAEELSRVLRRVTRSRSAR